MFDNIFGKQKTAFSISKINTFIQNNPIFINLRISERITDFNLSFNTNQKLIYSEWLACFDSI